MEKHEHKNELHTQVHPNLAVYLHGNSNEQPPNTNVSGATVSPFRCGYLENLYKNKSQIGSVAGGKDL